MKEKMNPDLLNDPINKLLVRLSLPVMLAGLLRTSYSFVDMLFASRLGGVQVASVAFVAPLFIIFQALGLGLSNGGVSIIAKLLGENNEKKASHYATQLRSLTLAITTLICILGLFISENILAILGLEGDMLRESAVYTQIRFYSIPFAIFVQLYMAYYKAQGKMAITTKIALMGVLGNTALNALFLFVFNKGIEGLAYATLITQAGQALYIYFRYQTEKHGFDLKWNFFSSKTDFKTWKELLTVGLPLSFSQASVQFGFLLINTFIVSYGYQVVAAFAIGNQVNSLFFSPTTGISQAFVPLIAQNWGQKSGSRIKETIRRGVIFTLSVGTVGAVCIQFIIRPLGTFLAKGDQVIITHTIHYVRLVGWTLIPWGLFTSLSGIFNGFQRTRMSMSINVIRLWGLRIPGLLLCSYVFTSLGEYGVWYTMFFSNVITALIAVVLYFIFVRNYVNEI
ncbi:MAG: MATE family efflux transporter [Spirochaetales bacterium]|nr:MATE family efflux transporter [Spirochaetales bacterium]